MSTVITRDALYRSNLRKITLGELKDTDCDEVFLFVYPSPDVIDQINGDGKLIEVWDHAIDLSWISVGGKEVKADKETELWVR